MIVHLGAGTKPRPKFAGANFGSLGKLVSPLNPTHEGYLKLCNALPRWIFEVERVGLRRALPCTRSGRCPENPLKGLSPLRIPFAAALILYFLFFRKAVRS